MKIKKEDLKTLQRIYNKYHYDDIVEWREETVVAKDDNGRPGWTREYNSNLPDDEYTYEEIIHIMIKDLLFQRDVLYYGEDKIKYFDDYTQEIIEIAKIHLIDESVE